MALRLKRRGIERVRPLEGGYAGWASAGFPLERRQPVENVLTSAALGA